MKLMILNGPNLNMVGIREKNIYGSTSYESIIAMIQEEADKRGIEVDCRQSNHEGDLVDWIQEAYFKQFDGIVINPGAYTHTSIALADAVHAIEPLPVVEVHISDISKREDFRQISYEAPFCIGQIKGHGPAGYVEAIDLILEHLNRSE
ncbi:MAG: type II 3-dehydroquinate dehydratase [Solobacterium sp.]|nr:type II 3-dehydroquinate dehydratase [Solobacterium sp.]MBR3347119.1 type II 3-dehydroquinate dehydratase [Solobacterium sp.]